MRTRSTGGYREAPTERAALAPGDPLPTVAHIQASVPGAEFKGLTIANVRDRGPLLYAADFTQYKVVVFNGHFQRTSVSGGFKDSTLPSGYGPFNVQEIGGMV